MLTIIQDRDPITVPSTRRNQNKKEDIRSKIKVLFICHGNNPGSNKTIQKMWDEISQMFLIGSLSGIAVLGDVIREYLPVNLILTFGFINVGIMLLKIYFQKKFEEKSLYADNHYD